MSKKKNCGLPAFVNFLAFFLASVGQTCKEQNQNARGNRINYSFYFILMK